MIDFPHVLTIHKSVLGHELNDKLYHVLKDLAIYGRTVTIKSVSGKNRSHAWRRSPLKGFHFYLWWFRSNNGVVVRTIRHHDNHHELSEGSSSDYVMVNNLYELKKIVTPHTLADSILSTADLYHQNHQKISVRFLKGAPGTGKTTILKELTESYHQNDHIIFASRSLELNKSSCLYLNAITDAKIDTLHLPSILANVQDDLPLQRTVSDERRIFLSELKKKLYQVPRNHLPIYYELVRAYVFGMSKTDKEIEAKSFSYELSCIEDRSLKTIAKMFKKHPLFDLQKAVSRFLSDNIERTSLREKNPLLTVHADRLLLLIDEIQDHTSLEIDLLLACIQDIYQNYSYGIEVIFSGDEGQSIYPTRFSWAMLSRKIQNQSNVFRHSSTYEKIGNLRSLPQIVKIVDLLGKSYEILPVDLRPETKQELFFESHDEEGVFEHSLYILKTTSIELIKNIVKFVNRENVFISLYELPDELNSISSYIWEVDDIKGLESQNVFIITDSGLIIEDEIPIYTRMKLDRIRVSISRATEKVIFISIESILPSLDKHLSKLFGDDSALLFKQTSFDELFATLNNRIKAQSKELTSKPKKSIFRQVKEVFETEKTSSKTKNDEETSELIITESSLINQNMIELEEMIDQCKFMKERSLEKSYQILIEAVILAFDSQDDKLILNKKLLGLFQAFITDVNLQPNIFKDYVDYKLSVSSLTGDESLLLKYILTSHVVIFEGVLQLLDYANIASNQHFDSWVKYIQQDTTHALDKILLAAKVSAVELFSVSIDRGTAGIDNIKKLVQWRDDFFQDSNRYSVYLKNFFYFHLESQQKKLYVDKRFKKWLSRSQLPLNPQMAYQMAGINLQSMTHQFKDIAAWPQEIIEQVISFLELRQVSASSTMMGDNNSQFKDEKPEHNVCLRGNIRVSQSFITKSFWDLCMSKSNPKQHLIFSLNKRGAKSLHWIEAVLFCNLLSKRLGLTPVYSVDEEYGLVIWKPLRKGVRLLTEAEWETIAWEGLEPHSEAFKNQRDRVTKDARKRRGTDAANVFGIKDIGGAAEWVYDSFDEDAYKSRSIKGNIEPLVDDMIIFNRIQRGEPQTAPSSALSLTKRFSHSGPMMQDVQNAFRIVID